MVGLDVCCRVVHRERMNELLVGYARVSTEQQDLTAQRNGLHALGVGDDRIYVDHGLTGSNRDRPGLRLALAACRAGDTLVVTKLDRLARSLPDARDILDELTKRNVKLSLGGSHLGTYTQAELAELFGVGRSTIYRTIKRIRPKPADPERPFAHFAHPHG
jgi:hypothetical protein